MEDRKLEFKDNRLVGCSTGWEKDAESNFGVWCTTESKKKYFIKKGETVEEALSRFEKNSNKVISKEEFYGKEIFIKKGENPIEVMLNQKEGHIKNAFYKAGLGNIDLVWGNNKAGLQHLIIQRDKKYKDGVGSIKGVDMAKLIPFIIKNGVLSEDDKSRIKIEYKDLYRVGISPSFHNEKVNWIVTAMEILK